jgi:plastocyanin
VSDNVRTTATAHRLRRRSATALMAISLAALGACSSDDEGGRDTTATTPSSSAQAPSTPGDAGSSTSSDAGGGSEQQSLAAGLVDFAIELPETQLAAGEYEFEVVNEGRASHDFIVERDGKKVAGTEILSPGDSASLSVDLEPGEYVVYCSVGNHRGMGMETTVTVT